MNANGPDQDPPLILIDSDILIDAGRSVSEAVESLRQIDDRSAGAISAITYMELMVGCRNKREMQRTERFLRPYLLISLDDAISRTAIDLLRRYRLSHGLLMPDALIAATALAQHLPLITQNQRDFRFIQGLTVLSYPDPFHTS